MAKYGLGQMVSDIRGGYKTQQAEASKSARAAQESEMGEMKLEEMRSSMQKEGSADAIRMMLSGDLEGAMAKYNKTGEDRMSELEFDSETGLVSWLNAEGDQQDAMIGHLMVSAGLKPDDLDTAEKKLSREKELVTHKAQEAKKYGIGKGSSRPTAYIQNLEYTMKKLTKGDARKAFQLMQLSKSDPQTAYSRILIGLQKQNKDAFDEEKMTEEEMRKAAKDAVTGFRQEMFDELLGKQKQSPTAQTSPASEEAAPAFDPNDPSALWR